MLKQGKHIFTLPLLLSAIFILTSFSLSASAGEWMGSHYVSDFATKGSWQIRRYSFDEKETQVDFCSAVLFSDHINAIRIGAYADGYSFGMNGLSPENNLAPAGATEAQYPLGFVFDHNPDTQREGLAVYLKDPAYPDDYWLSHFEADESSQPITNLKWFKTITFVHPHPSHPYDQSVPLIESDFNVADAWPVITMLNQCLSSTKQAAAPANKTVSAPAPIPVKDTSCPDDSTRLPLTGICRGRGVNYLNIVSGDAPYTAEGCDWVLNEAATPEDEFLLYLAMRCEGVTSELEFSAGAHLSTLSLVKSAFVDLAGDVGPPLVTLVDSKPSAPYQKFMSYVRADEFISKAEAKDCNVQSAGGDGWPDDALVVDVSAAEARKAPADEPRMACGRFGLNEDATSYWRVFQGYAWFFELGQDAYQDIDPRSLTLVKPDGQGGFETVDKLLDRGY